MQDSETLNRIAQWRSKALAGTISLEEMKEAIIVLRESRRSALSETSTRAAISKSRKTRDVDSMLDDL